jgi:hypothetical protein
MKKEKIVVRSCTPMDMEQIHNAFSVPDEHPLLNAFHQLIQDEIDDLITIISLPQTADKPQLLTHTAGGLEVMRNFQARLVQAHADTKRVLDKPKASKS